MRCAYHDCAGYFAMVAVFLHAQAIIAFNPGSWSGSKQFETTISRRWMTDTSSLADGTISRRAMCSMFPPALTSVLALSVPIASCDRVSAEEGASTVTMTMQSRQPFAPSLENLLPACRVRIYIDELLLLAKSLQESTNDQQEDQRWNDLEERLLLKPPTFLTRDEAMSSKKYMQIKTWSSWNKAQAEQRRADPFADAPMIDPASQLNQAFEQWGQERQWKILRNRQQAMERDNPMRAAFNAYTNNLVFGESYIFTGSPEERKRRIRNDDLPDVTAVIRSDLDLRDLYRNQVLTAIDDSKAELQYQLRAGSSGKSRNATELLELLEQSKKSCDEWFRFVPDADIKDAMVIALKEQ